ncbi:IS1595 family transposase [Marinicella meishanensis]|uniref:IS1595 family transposase n=1 Tax=Marinicella meishanensis TaxID=2873263 RepID=UPI001CC0507F|nr:IS1595 family transposase [Marinicella sp. NBU2979]
MPQQYRQRAERRDLTLDDIYRMSEQEAIQFIAKARWGSDTKEVCPRCGAFDSHYYKRTRKQWVCKHCNHTFSLTSSTVFANKKISARKLLKLICMFVIPAKGICANDQTGMFGLSHKCVWLISQKIREGLLRSRDLKPLTGMVHIDGAYFCGKRRHGRIRNYKLAHKHYEAMIASKGKNKPPLNPTQRRNYARRMKYRRVLLVFRQVSQKPGDGTDRTIVTVVKAEDENSVRKHVERFVEPGSTVWTDDHSSYNFLSEEYDHSTVEHSKEFMTVDGIHNNHAESFFSRVRRSELGVFHGMRTKYLMDYANDMAWRDDMRRKSIKELMTTLICKVMSVGNSIWWSGYQQGFNRSGELLDY